MFNIRCGLYTTFVIKLQHPIKKIHVKKKNVFDKYNKVNTFRTDILKSDVDNYVAFIVFAKCYAFIDHRHIYYVCCWVVGAQLVELTVLDNLSYRKEERKDLCFIPS